MENGALFLGKAEMLPSHAIMFQSVDLKQRVFRRVARSLPTTGPAPLDQGPPPEPMQLYGLDLLRNAALLASPVAQIVITADGLVALTNRQADTLFGVSSRDLGRPFRDLTVSYHPIELRKYIEQAQLERRTLQVSDVEYHRSGHEPLHLDVQVNPLIDTDASLLGVTLIFQDVTASRALRDELQRANQELETAYEELQSTNEELETTNEELQSTNEELETMNEELQSTNDELQSINQQLQVSTGQLDHANAFLDTVLASLHAGVAVVDRDLRVQVWNRQAEELWGLRPDEAVGQHLLNLDIGLPVDRLRPLIRQALGGDRNAEEVQLEAVNRRGRSITVRVACSPLGDAFAEPGGAIVVMEAGT